jgi:flagellar motility protein MotE (MotC chaperone)
MMRFWVVLALWVVSAPVWAAEHGGGEKPAEGGHGGAAGDASSTLPAEAPQLKQGRVFTETEVQVLLDLDQQRIAMERRSQALELREKLVDLMEQRLNARVAELEALKGDLNKLMVSVSGKDDKELQQLASIYGNMKPAAAAQVLNRLDNAIVMDILVRMPSKKSGKLMEALEPAKARYLSEMMAARTPPPSVSSTNP